MNFNFLLRNTIMMPSSPFPQHILVYRPLLHICVSHSIDFLPPVVKLQALTNGKSGSSALEVNLFDLSAQLHVSLLMLVTQP